MTAMFGPSLTIGEVFSYLGAFFVLAASDAFLARIAAPAPSNDWTLVIGTALQTVVLLAIGQRLRTGDRRRGRAAGVMFLTASVHAGVAGGLAAGAIGLEWPASAVIGAIAAFVVALVTRTRPSGRADAGGGARGGHGHRGDGPGLAPESPSSRPPTSPASSRSAPVRIPIVLVVASAAWWLATAVIIGLIGLREAGRADEDAGSGRRAGVSRLWAGMVAVVGLATAVTQGDMLASGDYGRVVEPWIADVALLVLAAVLIQRAFRRDDSAFVYPAALAMIIALTDFNISYLGGATEIGLLVEGLILLAVGFGAQRIRRMIGGSGTRPRRWPRRPCPLSRSRRPPRRRSGRSSRSRVSRRLRSPGTGPAGTAAASAAARP